MTFSTFVITVWVPIVYQRFYFEDVFLLGGSLDYVFLQKDCKNICRAKVYDLPIEV